MKNEIEFAHASRFVLHGNMLDIFRSLGSPFPRIFLAFLASWRLNAL